MLIFRLQRYKKLATGYALRGEIFRTYYCVELF